MALDEKPTDLDFANYSRLINTWELLSPYLNITKPEEVALKRDFYDYNQQKMEVLFKWRRKNGSRATRRVLARACRDAGEVALAERIEGVHRVAQPVTVASAGSIQTTPTELSSDAVTHVSFLYSDPAQAEDVFDVPRGNETGMANRVQLDSTNRLTTSTSSNHPTSTPFASSSFASSSVSQPSNPSIGSTISVSTGVSTSMPTDNNDRPQLIVTPSNTYSSLRSNTEATATQNIGIASDRDSTATQNIAIASDRDSTVAQNIGIALDRDSVPPASTEVSRDVNSLLGGSSSHVIHIMQPNRDTLLKIFKKYFFKIAEQMSNSDPIHFATKLMSASIIDSSVLNRVTFTQGWSPLHQSNNVLFAVEGGLKGSSDPIDFFTDFCSVVNDYIQTKKIASDMMHDAGLRFPQPTVEVLRQYSAPTSGPLHTSTNTGASSSNNREAETPPRDFSQYDDVRRYGQPNMIDLLNWIVAEEPGVWNEVGMQLGISQGRLNAISMNISYGGSPKIFFKEVLSLWERSRTSPYTWGTILKALDSPYVAQSHLALKVARKLDNK